VSDPTGQSADPVAVLAEVKRRRRNASIAGLATLVIVILLVFQMGSDTLKSYSFFVGAVPALVVYFLVGTRGLKGPKS
jgi:hypothetical protein